MRRISLLGLVTLAVLAGNVGGDARATEPGATWTDPFTGMEFVWVPGGCFKMGNDAGSADEKPVHEVCVDDFWLGKYEVTQAQWGRVIGGGKEVHLARGARFPVEGISWEDTQTFIESLNPHNTGVYRLPTEAEWEYACRSGGKDETYCGGAEADSVAWHRNMRGDSFTTQPVGAKEANGFGIHDMSGNVGEWVSDWYKADFYAGSPKRNPKGPASGYSHVLRGGSWINLPPKIRATARAKGRTRSLKIKLIITGFRLVREPE